MIWDHDLVPKVITSTGMALATTAQERAIAVVKHIQEVVRLTVEIELVDLE